MADTPIIENPTPITVTCDRFHAVRTELCPAQKGKEIAALLRPGDADRVLGGVAVPVNATTVGTTPPAIAASAQMNAVFAAVNIITKRIVPPLWVTITWPYPGAAMPLQVRYPGDKSPTTIPRQA